MTTHRHLFFLFLVFSFIACDTVIKSNPGSEVAYAETTQPDIAVVTQKNTDTLICGIDISHYQGDEIDYLNQKGDQLSFVICKATEGVTYTDPDFKNNWAMIQQKGFTRGAYHFYHCADDPKQQADFFIATLGPLAKTDFPLIVDFEENSIDKGCNKADIQKNLLLFLQLLEQKTGRKPILYTDTNTGNSQINNAAFAAYSLWIADYNPGAAPAVPMVWKNKTWTIWQKNPNYEVDSYADDFDVFNGNGNDFSKFIDGK